MKNLLLALITISLVFFVGSTVQAKKTLGDAQSALGDVVTPTGISEGNISVAAGSVVKGITASMGIVFFILMVYSGIVWMTARGEEDRVTKARETIIAATIGLAIVVSAYAVTQLVVDKIIKPNASEGTITNPDGTVSPASNTPSTPNSFGGVSLGCCITPLTKGDVFNYFTKSPTFSIVSQADCEKQAQAMVYSDSGNWQGQRGLYWDFYANAKTSQQCTAILSCWQNEGWGGAAGACSQAKN